MLCDDLGLQWSSTILLLDAFAKTRRRLARGPWRRAWTRVYVGMVCFTFAIRHLIVVCIQTCIFRCCIVFKHLYDYCMICCTLYLSCCDIMLKSGIYDFVICRGGTDMCFVLGFGRKRPDLKQYRISGLTVSYVMRPLGLNTRGLADPGAERSSGHHIDSVFYTNSARGVDSIRYIDHGCGVDSILYINHRRGIDYIFYINHGLNINS